MSLQVWLPLNGNLDNQGISGHTLTGSPASWSTNGKIGKCATFNGNTPSIIYNNTTDFNYTDNFSFCMWINHNFTGSTAQFAFTVGRVDYGDGRGYGVQIIDSTNIRFWFGTRVIAMTCSANEWHHIAMTVSGRDIKIYKDGILHTTSTIAALPTYSDGNGLGIGCFHYNGGNIYPYYGSLNDFRIYDHCLSAKEVKEISKGLVCHYKLSSCGGENLASNSYNFNSWSVGSGWISSIDSDDGSTVYSFSRSGASSNSWVRLIPTLKVDPNDYPNGITVSLDIKTPDVSAINQKCIGSLQTYQASGSRVGWFEPSWDLSKVVNNQWTRILYTFSQSALKINNTSGTTLSYTQFSFQLVQNGNISIKKIKIEEGSKATPWCPNPSDALYSTLGFNDGIEYDCSGYGNNGTKVGTITWSGDTARYSGSYMPTTNSSYISTTLNTSGYANSYTFSYWAKISNMSDKMAFGFSDGNKLNLYPTNSIFCWNTGDSADNPFQNNGTKVPFASYNGAWHHYAITGNGNTTTLYIDGEKKGTARTYRAITGTKLFLSGWDTGTSYKWTGGNISDFRIYTTAFSAEDVKSLYQVSASIDKTGVLSAYEFVEEE